MPITIRYADGQEKQFADGAKLTATNIKAEPTLRELQISGRRAGHFAVDWMIHADILADGEFYKPYDEVWHGVEPSEAEAHRIVANHVAAHQGFFDNAGTVKEFPDFDPAVKPETPKPTQDEIDRAAFVEKIQHLRELTAAASGASKAELHVDLTAEIEAAKLEVSNAFKPEYAKLLGNL